MDELAALIGKAIGLIIVAIVAVVVVVCLCVIIVPPGIAWRQLDKQLRHRYTLSNIKKAQCIAIGVTLFALPFVIVLGNAPDFVWLIAAWIGSIVSLSGVCVFLALAAYKQHFQKHRRIARIMRTQVIRNRMQTAWSRLHLLPVHSRLKAIERTSGGMHRELKELKKTTLELIEQGDTAFLAAERHNLETEVTDKPVAVLRNRLELVTKELAVTPVDHPRAPVLALHGIILKAKTIDAILGPKCSTARFDQLLQEQARHDSVIKECNIQVAYCSKPLAEKQTIIRQLKSQQLQVA